LPLVAIVSAWGEKRTFTVVEPLIANNPAIVQSLYGIQLSASNIVSLELAGTLGPAWSLLNPGIKYLQPFGFAERSPHNATARTIVTPELPPTVFVIKSNMDSNKVFALNNNGTGHTRRSPRAPGSCTV